MKKYLSIFVVAIMIVGCLSACGKTDVAGSSNGKKIQIVTTIFPEYDWVKNVLGDNPTGADVTMLIDSGVDLHSYQPSAEDILKVSTCDVFIYVGGESDEWVKDALKEATNKDMVVINLMEVLGNSVKEEEVVEGMQEDHEHDHDHEEADHEEADHEEHEEAEHADADHDEDEHADADHDEHEHDGEEVEYDEHVWLSLRNTATLVKKISETIQSVDPSNADVYKANAAAYLDKLNALDANYKKTVDGSAVKTLLFGDRFPFRYMVDDYGLEYYAAFVGCSAETEASFETISFLAKKVDSLSLKAVMTIEGKDHRIAETIVQNTKTHDQKILTMDSMQSVTADDVEKGASYLSIMENNLTVLKEALK